MSFLAGCIGDPLELELVLELAFDRRRFLSLVFDIGADVEGALRIRTTFGRIDMS